MVSSRGLASDGRDIRSLNRAPVWILGLGVAGGLSLLLLAFNPFGIHTKPTTHPVSPASLGLAGPESRGNEGAALDGRGGDTPAPVPPEEVVAAESGEGRDEVSTSVTLTQRIDALVASCASADPDVIGLVDLANMLAPLSNIDAASIERNEETGEVQGRLTFAGQELSGKFTMKDGRMAVQLRANPPGQEFILSDVSFVFSRDSRVKAGVHVQSHPVASGAHSPQLNGDVKYVGWGLEFDGNDVKGAPIAMWEADGGGFNIGRSDSLPGGSWTGLTRPRAFDVWESMLLPYAP